MTYYYHGTDKDSAKSIKSEGLTSSKSKYKGGLFFTKNHGEAQKYSKIASGGKLGVVLKVHSDHLDHKYIKQHDQSIIQYNGNIQKEHIKEDTTTCANIAGIGRPSNLAADQIEPAGKRKKKLREIIRYR